MIQRRHHRRFGHSPFSRFPCQTVSRPARRFSPTELSAALESACCLRTNVVGCDEDVCGSTAFRERARC